MSKTPKILIAGCGDVGSATGERLAAKGYSVYGLRRNTTQIPRSIKALSADLNDPATLNDLPAVDFVLYCAAPSRQRGDNYEDTYVQGLENLIKALPSPPLHCFFTSSTSVYHQDNHQWVDEHSPCHPFSSRGQIMLNAERQVHLLCPASTVVRFAGIYGPGREYLLGQVKLGKRANSQPKVFTNRIHRDDCAGILCHLIEQKLAAKPLASLYLGCDSLPSPLYDVTQWLAQQLDITSTDASLSRDTPSKRCSNQRLLDSGYQFIYSDYRQGYAELLHPSPVQ
ncbi:MAG: SDR family oxidoreductase [Pseudomonadales bacterium]